MIPKFPETLSEKVVESISFAPEEWKIPSTILKEEEWDIKSFPCLRPSGKMDFIKSVKLKGDSLTVFDQRLKNKDKRCEQCTPHVFAAVAFNEERQERNIGISYCKWGKAVSESDQIYTLDDGFAVLDNVKGTPRYWRKAKMEMIAKLQHFGPFHLFYTLSYGHMRWDENFTSILVDKGYIIVWQAENENIGNSIDVSIKVEHEKDGKTSWD